MKSLIVCTIYILFHSESTHNPNNPICQKGPSTICIRDPYEMSQPTKIVYVVCSVLFLPYIISLIYKTVIGQYTLFGTILLSVLLLYGWIGTMLIVYHARSQRTVPNEYQKSDQSIPASASTSTPLVVST